MVFFLMARHPKCQICFEFDRSFSKHTEKEARVSELLLILSSRLSHCLLLRISNAESPRLSYTQMMYIPNTWALAIALSYSRVGICEILMTADKALVQRLFFSMSVIRLLAFDDAKVIIKWLKGYSFVEFFGLFPNLPTAAITFSASHRSEHIGFPFQSQ